MTTDATPEMAYTKEDMEMHYAYAVTLRNEGLSSLEVGSRLMADKGLDHQTASTIIDNLPDDIHITGQEEERKKHVISGGLWLLGGSLVTAISYTSASPGEKYILAYGAILYGLYRIYQGFTGIR